MSSGYQPYVEDYDSVIGDVVPSTARRGHPTRLKPSNLAEVSSATDTYEERISDSGYSSPPTESTPPLPSSTPAQRPPTRGASRNTSNPLNRPSSKASVPRNIPNARPRNASTASTGGADECDCPDCKTTSKPSPSSPSILSGAWPVHHSGSYPTPYGHSPQYPYQYPMYSPAPPTESGVSTSSSKRSSIPPPPRPGSTFGGSTTSSSWTQSGGYGGGYFAQVPHPHPSPAPPAPSSTCPPIYSSVFAPPSSVPSPGPYPTAGYTYGPDYWARSGTPTTSSSGYPESGYSSMPPPPPANRRSSMRSHTKPTMVVREGMSDEYNMPSQQAQRRPSTRVHGERPMSWQHGQSPFAEAPNRTVSQSVPPTEHSVPEARRRMTPQPPMRRRESGASQSNHSRLPPSSLSRAMEACAIDDDPPPPPPRSQSRSQHNSHGSLTRRETGTLMHASRSNQGSDSGSSRSSGSQYETREEMVQLTIPDTESESFTMTYPAGIPVKLQMNAYQFVQQRQQQVHAQLRYGANQLDHGDPRRSSGEYTTHRVGGYRRGSINTAY